MEGVAAEGTIGDRIGSALRGQGRQNRRARRGRKDDEEGKEKPKKPRRPKPKLTPALLASERGVRVCYDVFPKKLKFKGKGFEKEDLKQLLISYEEWAMEFFPHYNFDDFVEQLERHSGTQPVKDEIRRIQEGMPHADAVHPIDEMEPLRVGMDTFAPSVPDDVGDRFSQAVADGMLRRGGQLEQGVNEMDLEIERMLRDDDTIAPIEVRASDGEPDDQELEAAYG